MLMARKEQLGCTVTDRVHQQALGVDRQWFHTAYAWRIAECMPAELNKRALAASCPESSFSVLQGARAPQLKAYTFFANHLWHMDRFVNSCCQHIFQCRHITHDSSSRPQQRQRHHGPCTLAKPEPQLQHRAATAKLLHEALPPAVPCFSALVRHKQHTPHCLRIVTARCKGRSTCSCNSSSR